MEYNQSLIVSPQMVEMWSASAESGPRREDFTMIADHAPEVVILGTGSRIVFPGPELTRPLVDAGIGLEVMDTQAACRTYNILLADGRAALAALLV